MDASSLSFELFAICVKVCKLLIEADGLPKDTHHLRIRLQIERDKLVDWAVLAHLSEDERTLSSGLQLNRHKINGGLQEIRLVLLDLTKFTRWPDPNQIRASSHTANQSLHDSPKVSPLKLNSSLQKKAISFAERTRVFPRKISWTAFDQKAFEFLLAKLAALIQNMTCFFDERQQKIHLQMQENTFMGILQASNQLSDLNDAMASLKAASLFRRITVHEQRLLQLARFKAFQVAISEAGDSFNEIRIRDFLADPPNTHPGRILLDGRRYIAGDEIDLSEYEPVRTWGTYETLPVWIEWKYYEPIGNKNQPPSYIEGRIAKLATLLRDKQKPEQFGVPNCLGYLHDTSKFRYGFVFQGAGNFPPPRLLDMIASSTRPRPSLTTRIQIARAVATSIWYLHATNWLHQGLRSENIIFPFKLPAPPFLTGFEYSRPANANEASERPGKRYHDLYRHPLTQFDVPGEGRDGFKKLYDIYSLGVVLYEIGMWKPVHAILGIDITGGMGPAISEIRDTQRRLLSEECLLNLAADAGDAYMATVASCLSGDFGFDSFDGQSEQANYDARLQLEFGDRVIRKLENILV